MRFSKGVVLLTLLIALLVPTMVFSGVSVFVTGTVRYDPTRAWNGFVILPGEGSAKLIDMNGNLVHEWDLKGGVGMPNKVYKGGYLFTSIFEPWADGTQDLNTVALLDWDGNIVRSFNKYYQVKKPSKGMPVEADGTAWISRASHEWQIEGDPVGYYSPVANADLKNGRWLIVGHQNPKVPKINKKVPLHDDVIYIVDKDGKVTWEWKPSDHFDELGLDKYPQTMALLGDNRHPLRGPVHVTEGHGLDWFHVNCASWLGPNKWYDQGDQGFHPENIVGDSREMGFLYIIDHKTGKIVWMVKPPFDGEDAKLGNFYGPHHTHMIPRGLPGEGNILVFDNGGVSPFFPCLSGRYYTRVVEIDPVKKEIVWEYSHRTMIKGQWWHHGHQFFFSPFISLAQRLPNGNTFITEGASNRLIEVTRQGEIVWEYVLPYRTTEDLPLAYTYRAYRVPYDYIPQLKKPREVAVIPPENSQIVLPNVEGVLPDYAPKVDKRPANQFKQPAPVQVPGIVIKSQDSSALSTGSAAKSGSGARTMLPPTDKEEEEISTQRY